MLELQNNFNWDFIREKLKIEFGEQLYNAWLSDIDLYSINKSEIILSIPTAFLKEWVTKEYFEGKFKSIDGKKVCIKKGIKQIIQENYPNLISISIIVDKKESVSLNNENNVKSISENDNIHTIGINLNKSYTFENFIVSSSNKLAYQVANSIANEKYINLDINPFFLYGSVGLGKTHLCQAIAMKIKETQSDKVVVYLTAEKFMFLFVQSIQNKDINAFKNKLRNIDILIVDDIQFIIGKDKTQEEFFHTFETLINENKHIILACDRSPANLEELDNKLKSRINGGLIVDIKEFDFELKYNLILKKSEILNINLDRELVSYISENINGTGRDIEGFLKKLKVNQDIMNIKITKKEIDLILNDFISKKIINIDIIQSKVAEYYKVTMSDLKSEKRNKELVIARHTAMYLSKILTKKSFPDIAKSFSGKNHATVIHAVNKISKNITTDYDLRIEIEKIKELIL